MRSSENIRSILKIFIFGIIFFLVWDILESYFLNPPKVEDTNYKKVEVKYKPNEIEEFLLEKTNENN